MLNSNTLNDLTVFEINGYNQIELIELDGNTWNHLTAFKQMSSNYPFENKVTNKLIAYKSWINKTGFGIK